LTSSPNTREHADRNKTLNAQHFRRTTLAVIAPRYTPHVFSQPLSLRLAPAPEGKGILNFRMPLLWVAPEDTSSLRLVFVVRLLRFVRLRRRRRLDLGRWTSLLPLARRRVLRRPGSGLVPRWRRWFVARLRRTIHLRRVLLWQIRLRTIRLRTRFGTVVRRHAAGMIVARRRLRRAVHVGAIVRSRLIRLGPIRLCCRPIVARRRLKPTVVVRPIVGSWLIGSRLVRLRAIARIGLIGLGPIWLRLVRLRSVVVRLI